MGCLGFVFRIVTQAVVVRIVARIVDRLFRKR
jgi:hypothetical protein